MSTLNQRSISEHWSANQVMMGFTQCLSAHPSRVLRTSKLNQASPLNPAGGIQNFEIEDPVSIGICLFIVVEKVISNNNTPFLALVVSYSIL